MSEPLIQLRRSPHISRTIDNTALGSYMECPRKYYYGMHLNRRKGGLTKPALAYGTCWHAGMEEHYKTGGDQQAVVSAMVNAWQPHDNPDDHRTLERCVSEYGKYLEHYGTFEKEVAGWGSTVGFPENPVVEMATEIWWQGALHPYAGKIDRVFEFQGLYYVEDHKTTGAMGTYYFQQFDPSNQMMGYAVLGQELTGLPIAGVRINAHAVLKTTSKFARSTITYAPERLEEWKRNYNLWVSRLEEAHELADPKRGMVHNAPESAFPMNLNACAGKFGPCSYVGVCTYPERLRPRILESEYDELPWDPMAPEDGEAEA